nr:replication factor A protein 1-like [Ipomoea batatas]
MAPMYILARDIQTRNTTAAMRLRLVRTYDILQRRYSDKVKSRECVFHDEEGSYVHFHIPGKNVSVSNEFMEGHVNCIKNFLTRNTTAAMRLRLVRTYDILQSRYSDKVKSRECVFHDEECSYVHFHIPGNNVSVSNEFMEGHVYCIKNFLSFNSINTLEGIDEKVLIDVIGRVVQIFSPLDKLINGRRSKLIDFVIEDLKGIQLKCTVWDQHVEKVMPFFKSDLTEAVIVLIQMCRVKVAENSGEVKICSSYDATQLLFNQDCLEFTDFRERLCNELTPLKSMTSNSSLSYSTYSMGDQSSSNMVISTISELFERSEIKIRVVDANGNAPFLLWDRESLELLGGITAEELKAMQPKVPTKIPKDIKSLDIAVLNQYCPGLLNDTKQKGTDFVEPLDDDLDSDAGFFSDEVAESPLPNSLTQMAKVGGNESEVVKRRLLDEFSSTQYPKKKTHTAIIKLEKDNQLGGDQNSKN